MLARIRPLLLERGRRGLVRRGHGDLHLGNIVLIDGRPVLFDAIEFDPLIASGDVLYDLAFLLMDLTERGIEPTANIVLNRYLAETRRTEDLDALAALPLFMSMRAAIRAKVTAARPARADPETEARSNGARAGISNSPAASRAAATDADGRRRAFRHGQIVARARAGAGDRAGSGSGGAALRRRAQGAVRQGRERQAAGRGAYAPEATARSTPPSPTRRGERWPPAIPPSSMRYLRGRRNARAGQSAAAPGVRFRGLFLDADLATRLARVEARRGDASDADAALARSQESYDLGPIDWRRVDASGRPSVTLARAWAAMRE